MSDHQGSLGRSAATVSALTLGSRILGFVRDMALARLIGAGPVADALFLALRVPELMRRLVAEGAVAAALAPAVQAARHAGGPTAAAQLVSAALGVVLPLALLVSALAALAAPGIAAALGGPDPRLTAILLAAVAPFLGATLVSALLGALLNGLNRFACVAAMPVLLNLVLLMALALAPSDQVALARWQAGAMALGGLVQAVVLAVACRGFGLRLSLPGLPGLATLSAIGRALLPAVVSIGLYQLLQFIGGVIAARSGPGAVAHLHFADRFVQLPLGVLGIGISTALTQTLAAQAAAGSTESPAESQALEATLAIALPAGAALALIAPEIVRAVYQGGAFGADATRATAQTLAVLAGGLPGFVLARVLMARCFALARHAVLVRSGVLALAVFGVVIVFATSVAGTVPVAAAISLGGWAQCVGLWRRGVLRPQQIWRLVRLGLATGIMALGLLGLKPLAALLSPVAALGLLVAGGLGVYALAARLLCGYKAWDLWRALKH